MTLADLIEKSKKDEKKIRQEYQSLLEFQKTHPWIMDELVEASKQDSEMENLLSFKEDYFLDNMSKVYRQIVKDNPLLIDKGTVEVAYYSVKPNYYKNQLKNGLKLGEADKDGNIVTGSNLILEIVSLEMTDFLYTYYANNN